MNLLLSSATNDSPAIYGIASIIILVLLVILVYAISKAKGSEHEMLDEFFEILKDSIRSTILDIITKFDISKLINSTEPYELAVKEIYNKVYDYCLSKTEEVSKENNNIVLESLTKLLTRDKVKEYVDVILDTNSDIKEKLTDLINVATENKNVKEEEADKARSEELKDEIVENLDELEESGEVIDDELRETPQLDANFKPINQEINPPRDDDYDPTDNEEGTEEVDTDE